MNRIAEIFVKDDVVVSASKWQPIDFRSIKAGDCFRLFESDDGSIVKDEQGNIQWVAKSDAYLNPKGVYEIKVK